MNSHSSSSSSPAVWKFWQGK